MNLFEPNFELAQQKARQDFTTLLDIYATSTDADEKQLLAHVIRIAAAYIAEIKRQHQRVIADRGHTLDMLFAYARQASYALSEFPRSTRGMKTMNALLNDAVAFLRVVQ